MSSKNSPSDLIIDLDRDLPVTKADIAAQAQPPPALSFAEYLEWLSAQTPPTYEQLRARRGPHGPPFSL